VKAKIKSHYDYIVIGAGPAGLSFALHVAALGQGEILIVEAKKLPRSKPCAGYLSSQSKRALLEMGIAIEELGYEYIANLSVNIKNEEKLALAYQGLYCAKQIDRYELDKALYERALSCKDVTIIDEAAVSLEDIHFEKSELRIQNSSVGYSHLIFSDGANGVSRQFIRPNAKRYIAIMAIKKASEGKFIKMDLGIARHGYAWQASNGKYTNIGFCDIYSKGSDYRQQLFEYIRLLGESEEGWKISAHFVPFGLQNPKLLLENVHFIGDSIGFVEPLTLSGVSYALLSGKYLATKLCGESRDFERYLSKTQVKFFVSRILHWLLYRRFTLFLVNHLGKILKRPISYVLDHFIFRGHELHT